MAYQIARELVKRKHEVVVYTSDAKDLGSRLSVKPVKVFGKTFSTDVPGEKLA